MTAAIGGMGKSMEALRLGVADSTSFRAWVGATTREQALTRIHFEGLPPPLSGDVYTADELIGLRPHAIIYSDPQRGYEVAHVAGGPSFSFTEVGRLIMRVEADIPNDILPNKGETMMRFLNNLDGLLADLCSLAGTAGYLAIASAVISDGPYVHHENLHPTMGAAQGVDIAIEWGPQ